MSPHKDIYKFEGTVKNENNQAENPIDLKSFIPRAASVENSSNVYALVVYTGKDTKLCQNEGKYSFKISDL